MHPQTPIEASGICYDDVGRRYVVISDETDGKKPVLFMMDDNGVIESYCVIRGVPKVNDFEGITVRPDGYFYLLTSQSHNRKGKLSENRKLFLKVIRDGKSFSVSGRVTLYDCLESAAATDTGSSWSRFIAEGIREKSIDIEGVAFTGDTLLLGFKNPKKENAAVILGIHGTEEMFSNGHLRRNQVFLWNSLTLYDSVSGSFCGVSDLYMHENGLLVGTATGVSGHHGMSEDVGLVWSYDTRMGTLKIIRQFSGTKPEGITYNKQKEEYCIVFDNGSKNPSYYMKVKAPL